MSTALFDAPAALRRSFQEWRTYRRTVHLLRELDPGQLDDIGISRRDIRRVAWDRIKHAS